MFGYQGKVEDSFMDRKNQIRPPPMRFVFSSVARKTDFESFSANNQLQIITTY